MIRKELKAVFCFMVIVWIFAIVAISNAGQDYVISEEILSITGASASLASVPATAENALLSLSGDSIRWKGHLVAPTAAAGNIMAEGDYLYLDTRDKISKFQAILKTGGSAATIYVMYYGKP